MSNIFITIGNDCSSRSSLCSIKLFNGSYPFDDKICDEKSLILTLKDDFKDFLNSNYYTFDFNEFFRPINKYGIVLDHLYGFDLHDNITKDEIEKKINIKINYDNNNYINSRVLYYNWLEQHDNIVIPKIERRINRFREAFQNNNNIYFWRYANFSKDGCIEINNILKNRYKNFNLTIIIIHWYDSNIFIPEQIFYDLDFVKKYYFDISKDHPEQWNIIKNNLNI